MDATPVTLLQRLRQAPDADVWARFVRLCTPLLFSWARHTGMSENDAADLVHAVFVVLVQELPKFDYDPQRSFRGWLRTVLLNRWRTLRRQRRPVPLPGLEAEAEPSDPALPDEEEDRRQLLDRALLLVRPEFQPGTWEAFRQYVLLGRPVAEVAAELGMSVNAVYVAKSRVLQRLRQEVGGLVD